METNYSRLFIPPARDGEPALEWRLALIWQEVTLDVSILRDGINKKSIGQVTPSEADSWLRLAVHPSLAIDEIDRTILTVTPWMLSADNLDTPSRDHLTRAIAKCREIPNDLDSKELDSWLQVDGKMLLEDEVPRIRAKLAVKEVIAAIVPDLLITHLVEVSHRYLGCSVVQSWIARKRHERRYGSAAQKQAASRELERLGKAILGDGRQKTRKYPYWELYGEYGELSAAISELRKKHQSITGKVSSAELLSFCEQWNIPNDQRDLILSKLDANAPKTLSLQIMQSKGMIEDPKAFLDFQPFVSRMNQNRDLRIKSKIAEMLLDFPTCHPEMMQPEKHWDTLEAVALKTH